MKLAPLLLAAFFAAPTFAQQHAPAVSPQSGGRYQIFQPTKDGGRVFLLDTATGKSWIFVYTADGATFYWEPMTKVDTDAEDAAIQSKHPKKP